MQKVENIKVRKSQYFFGSKKSNNPQHMSTLRTSLLYQLCEQVIAVLVSLEAKLQQALMTG